MSSVTVYVLYTGVSYRRFVGLCLTTVHVKDNAQALDCGKEGNNF